MDGPAGAGPATGCVCRCKAVLRCRRPPPAGCGPRIGQRRGVGLPSDSVAHHRVCPLGGGPQTGEVGHRRRQQELGFGLGVPGDPLNSCVLVNVLPTMSPGKHRPV